MLQKGLKVFGNKGHEASMKEIDQLHKRMCFAPLKVKEMKHSKRKKAQMALMFLTEKRDKSVKGRMVYNGKPTRELLEVAVLQSKRNLLRIQSPQRLHQLYSTSAMVCLSRSSTMGLNPYAVYYQVALNIVNCQ
jgi:hypothetical protein